MTCSFLMQSWLSLRYLCPSSHKHTHAQTHIDFTCKTNWSLSSNTPLKNRFDTPTYSIQNLIHTDLADINCIQTGFSNRNWLKCNILLYTTQYTETKDTASNKQGTNCFLRWDSSRSWLAGRATGHRPTLRKWETPLWGWSLWHWVRNIINNNKMLRGFFSLLHQYTWISFNDFSSCRDERKQKKFSVWALREGRLPQFHICGYHVDQVLSSDWPPIWPKVCVRCLAFNFIVLFLPLLWAFVQDLSARHQMYYLKWPYCGKWWY